MANRIGATDCDLMVRAVFRPDVKETFFDNPYGTTELFHFTDHDEFDVYNAVDPEKVPALRQEGKVVVISGGGRGVGRGIAVMFAKAGAKAIGICARTVAQLEETKRAVEKVNPETSVLIQHVNITSEDDVKSFFENVHQRFGKIDVAVSNAGVNAILAPTAETETDQWWGEVEVNLKGTYLFSKYFIRNLKGAVGTLVNISSCNALVALPHQSTYCVNKLAAVRLLESVHYESPNVRCFSLHPGIVDTVLYQDMQKTMGMQCKWKYTSPELTGAMILWLTTPGGDFLRGRWLSVNWRVDELEKDKEVIVKENLLKTAFNGKLGIERTEVHAGNSAGKETLDQVFDRVR